MKVRYITLKKYRAGEFTLELYHGSNKIIEAPGYGLGKDYNDYGRGFYCTEHIDLAREWACTEGEAGYVNHYILNTRGLKHLDLCDEDYSVLNWLAILVDNRRMNLSTPLMKRGKDWLLKHYLIDISPFDLICGYRADDSYFSFTRAFLSNQITLEQLAQAMNLGELGVQKVLKSKRAFKNIEFIKFEAVDASEYLARRMARDQKARDDYQKLLEENPGEGLFLSDLMKKG